MLSPELVLSLSWARVSTNRGYACCRGSLESEVAAPGCGDGVGLSIPDGLHTGQGLLQLPIISAQCFTVGLSLAAGLSLLSPPALVSKDMHQTWRTLPLY